MPQARVVAALIILLEQLARVQFMLLAELQAVLIARSALTVLG